MEVTVSFHLTCDTLEEAEQWKNKVVEILDQHTDELGVSPESDRLSNCSGHVSK